MNRKLTSSLAGGVALLLGACSNRLNATVPGVGSATAPSLRPTATALTGPTLVGSAPCLSSQLGVRLGQRAQEASQTLSIIILSNHGADTCTMRGYPGFRVAGRAATGQPGRLDVTVTHGSTYFRRDPGPRSLALAPGAAASFALESRLAFQGEANPYVITELDVSPPGAGTSLQLACRLGLTGPVGQPFPITVTALVAGVAGPPE